MIESKKKLFVFGGNTWKHLTECKKKSTGLFKNVINKMFKKSNIFNIYV